MTVDHKLNSLTADLGSALAATGNLDETAVNMGHTPKTAPGVLASVQGKMHAMGSELMELRARLANFDGGMPTVKLDPRAVRGSIWANRSEASFATAAFSRLKLSITGTGGNTQPILVRRAGDDQYEIVFGHRRHRACLEAGLPVLAVLWSGPMSDLDLLISMDRENREREDPSAYEQGKTYLAALQSGLVPSQRRLAEVIGVSHTWVRKAIQVAQLPDLVVRAFASPLAIQSKHAEAIHAALERDTAGVMQRAQEVISEGSCLRPPQVVSRLIGQASASGNSSQVKMLGRQLGTWTVSRQGKVVVTLERTVAGPADIHRVVAALGALLPEPGSGG